MLLKPCPGQQPVSHLHVGESQPGQMLWQMDAVGSGVGAQVLGMALAVVRATKRARTVQADEAVIALELEELEGGRCDLRTRKLERRASPTVAMFWKTLLAGGTGKQCCTVLNPMVYPSQRSDRPLKIEIAQGQGAQAGGQGQQSRRHRAEQRGRQGARPTPAARPRPRRSTPPT